MITQENLYDKVERLNRELDIMRDKVIQLSKESTRMKKQRVADAVSIKNLYQKLEVCESQLERFQR